MKKNGFTLIELLVVVAIIAILVAIVIPNFMNAQIRAKVTRSKADIKSVVNALMMYQVDNNSLPPLQLGSGSTILLKPRHLTILNELTTPVSYINAGGVRNPFSDFHGYWYYGREYFMQTTGEASGLYRTFYWNDPEKPETAEWMVSSLGPNTKEFGYDTTSSKQVIFYDYDITNGLTSRGIIQKHGK